VRVTIHGHHLPGRRFASGSGTYANVHVAVQERADPVGLVAGDAEQAAWTVEVRVVTLDDGRLDFRGPAVHGKRGERFLYLTWGDVHPGGRFAMFRRAKLMLDRVGPDLVRAAESAGRDLVARVDLTDACGGPRCARVDPPAIRWAVADTAPAPRAARATAGSARAKAG
jgi:hypothetical protein